MTVKAINMAGSRITSKVATTKARRWLFASGFELLVPVISCS
jgi:hypothetical protein